MCGPVQACSLSLSLSLSLSPISPNVLYSTNVHVQYSIYMCVNSTHNPTCVQGLHTCTCTPHQKSTYPNHTATMNHQQLSQWSRKRHTIYYTVNPKLQPSGDQLIKEKVFRHQGDECLDTVQDGLANLHAILIDSHINENKHRHAHTLRPQVTAICTHALEQCIHDNKHKV